MTSLLVTWSVFIKFHRESPWVEQDGRMGCGIGNSLFKWLKWLQSTNIAKMPIFGRNTRKVFSRTKKVLSMNLGLD